MEDSSEKKEIIGNISKILEELPESDLSRKLQRIVERLFEFANFIEAGTVLLYVKREFEVETTDIIKGCYSRKKNVVLPAFDIQKNKMKLMKVENLKQHLKKGPLDIAEPDPDVCKPVPIDQIDIAVVPGLAFDEKGGRIGFGEGHYKRLMTKLPSTTRKIAIAFEEQIVPQIPMDSRNKNVDIIVTDERIIYKI
jgi:5-formyltetrahydrofolate cyclo-ligase